MTSVPHYSIYGVTVASEFAFRWPLPVGGPPADLVFDCRTSAPLGVDPDAAPLVHAVDVGRPDGAPGITYHRMSGLDVVRVRHVADHYVGDDRIVCHLHDPDLSYLVEIQLLGMVLALWLERRGIPVLHSAAVAVGDRGVAFLGEKGGGKTTLAGAMVAEGHPLLADDLLALDAEEAGTRARSGYPVLRLWPDQLGHFRPTRPDGVPETASLVHPAFDKVWLPLDGRPESFRAAPVDLARIYLPVRHAGGPLRLEPLRPGEAVVELVRHSYLRSALHPLGLEEARLPRLGEVCGRVPVSRLHYPDGLDRLSEVVEAVEADLDPEAVPAWVG
jgi:hypothetical protein